MAKKAVNLDVEVLKETEGKLVVRANKPLKKDEFNLLSGLVKKQEQESGIKIVVLPHSTEVEGENEELAEAKAEVEKLEKALAELSEVVAEKEILEKKLAELEGKKEADDKVKKGAEKKTKKEKETEVDN